MSDLVVRVLQQIGPCVSSDLVAALTKNHGLAPATARQRVSRSTAIKKLAHVVFPRGARFVYLQSTYASPEFWGALVRDLLKYSVAYGGGLAALMARAGMMPVAHFATACGAPVAQKRHVSASAVLDRLKSAGLVQAFEVPGVGACVELSQKTPASASEIAAMRARLRTEEVLLHAIKDWTRNLGLVSYGTVKLRDEDGIQPKVGTFNWDLTAPSYLGPLTDWSGAKPKSGFVVCDVLLGVNVSALELQPFINKCKTLRSLPRVGRCLQVFVADGYTQEALGLAKKAGLVPATTSALFGQDVARALRQLADILKDVYPRDGAFEKVDEVFTRLSHIEGAANNLRGALFEFVVAEVVRLTSPHTNIQLNEILRDDEGGTAEIDVYVFHVNRSVRFIECKGYKPGGTIPDELVERWLNDRVPSIRQAAQLERFWRNCKLEFEFWTSGRLSAEARAMVEAEAAKVRKFTLTVVEGEEVANIVRGTNNTALKKTYREHFLDHPLEQAERAARKPKRGLRIPPASKLAKRDTPTDASDFCADD